MTGPVSPELHGDLVATASRPGFSEWLSMVKATGGCAQPIHLWGQSTTVHAGTGEVLSERPAGRLLVACGNRRASRCPSCSETYRADTYQLIRAGLVGGKTVPGEVRNRPRMFVTFTAPSFGPVHHRTVDPAGRPHRCHPGRCDRRHAPDDQVLGHPLDPDTYDYVGAVIWNALATRLWARTVQLVNRHAARLLGVPQKDWPAVGRVSVAKVAEYQARGMVHFHAIFRLDGPQPDLPPPAGTTLEVLEAAIRHAASRALVSLPDSRALAGQSPVVWGDQLDLKPIESTEANGRLSDGQVAGYIAKYATKGAETTGTIDHPVSCRDCKGTGHTDNPATVTVMCPRCEGTGLRHAIAALPVYEHARRMITTCWTLGGHPELAQLRLRPWAHMLGFRGHFSTKSRRYSTTLGCLRQARQAWRSQGILGAHGLGSETPVLRTTAAEVTNVDIDDDVVLVIGDWRYIGHGHSPGQAVYADTIRHDLAESRRIWRQVRHDDLEAAA